MEVLKKVIAKPKTIFPKITQRRKGKSYTTLQKRTGIWFLLQTKELPWSSQTKTHIEKSLALINDEEVYYEYRHQAKSFCYKVLKQLLHKKNLHWTKIQGSLHQTSTLQVDNSPPSRFYGILPKFIKPLSPLDL